MLKCEVVVPGADDEKKKKKKKKKKKTNCEPERPDLVAADLDANTDDAGLVGRSGSGGGTLDDRAVLQVERLACQGH